MREINISGIKSVDWGYWRNKNVTDADRIVTVTTDEEIIKINMKWLSRTVYKPDEAYIEDIYTGVE